MAGLYQSKRVPQATNTGTLYCDHFLRQEGWLQNIIRLTRVEIILALQGLVAQCDTFPPWVSAAFEVSIAGNDDMQPAGHL